LYLPKKCQQRSFRLDSLLKKKKSIYSTTFQESQDIEQINVSKVLPNPQYNKESSEQIYQGFEEYFILPDWGQVDWGVEIEEKKFFKFTLCLT